MTTRASLLWTYISKRSQLHQGQDIPAFPFTQGECECWAGTQPKTFASKGTTDMSPTVNNFVHDLVAMAKAMEDLPEVQAQLAVASQRISELSETVQDRELSIIDYKATITDLLAKQRDLEVARDDAELRFLELDEQAGKAVHSLADIMDIANELRTKLDTVGVKQPEPTPIISEVKPIAADPVRDTSADWFEDHDHASQPPQGQSEADPTLASNAESAITQQATVLSGNVETPVTASTDPAPKPYAGKRYIDIPRFVSYSDWLAGGGTDEMYYTRGYTRGEYNA